MAGCTVAGGASDLLVYYKSHKSFLFVWHGFKIRLLWLCVRLSLPKLFFSPLLLHPPSSTLHPPPTWMPIVLGWAEKCFSGLRREKQHIHCSSLCRCSFHVGCTERTQRLCICCHFPHLGGREVSRRRDCAQTQAGM